MKRAIVIGAGPNGLTAAIVLARAGAAVTLIEAAETVGGGLRSRELTLPGFTHDVCSAVHPLAAASPVFASFPLSEHGLEWVRSPAALAHPLDDGSAALLEGSVEDTARGLGPDAEAYRRAAGPLLARWPDLIGELLDPPHLPRHPLLLARFARYGLPPAASAARRLFRGEKARALLSGLAGHFVLPLEKPGSSAVGWILGLAAHAVGWPVPRGGSQRLADALASYLESLGGRIVLGQPVRSLSELEPADAVLCDVTPRQLLALTGSRLPDAYRRKLERWRYGPGAFKLDWALDGPIPWRAAECLRAATVHVGGTLEEIAASERAVWQGRIVDRPFVLLAQPSLFDPTRAPAGQHTAWAYCHVPHGSTVDASELVERQVERFAPGFRKRILARHAMGPAALEAHNPNLVGGDIAGGAQDLRQALLRPSARVRPGLYLCSASTPPGPGVHGMCGYHAAAAALEDMGVQMLDSRRENDNPAEER